MSLHKEIHFEAEICEYLANHGWLYAESDAANYDRARALFPADVLAWVQATQPQAWETLSKNHGAQAAETLLARLRDQLDQRGTLDVLRHGIELLGLKSPLKLAEFKPALAINPDILARHAANRLRVVRQLRYSLHNENCIDLGLFLNGLPVGTAELKTDFTQSINDAIDQYRFDRDPKPKGQAAEPLLSFPNGALVHFAVSNSEVHMVTRLAGPATVFLPFNLGNEGAAGNPPNPQGGHRTAYLWEKVWARESWLEILGRYLIAQRDKKKQIERIIFPRFHQLDVTRAVQSAVLRDGPGNLPAPFHVYSMRQAIEEKFILDVLQNYTSYKLAFKLAHDGKDYDEKTVERSAALKGIMGWVRLHPYNIAQKVQIVVEHFREFVAPLLNGTAKAMVVVGSRVEAVRWKLAIEKYIADNGYRIGTLVAFSGEVNDPESGPEGFSEHSLTLNPNLKGRDIREAFKGDEYRILLVANKFQTGFDQPLLCGMYVDKRLAGIQAVQTLSRLNRAYPGKDTTYVLDFVNDSAEVLAAFKTYHTTAELAATTDPHLVYDLRAKLDAAGHYDDFEVDRVVAVELNPNAKQSELVAALEPVRDRLMKRYKAAQEALKAATEKNDAAASKSAQDELDALILFKGDMGAYIRLYTFLSQIFDYGNTAIEKRAHFYKRLLPLLEFGREREGIDLSKVQLTHHHLKHLGKQAMPLNPGEKPLLPPITEAGSGSVQEKTSVYMGELIEKLNELFGAETTDQDQLVYVNHVIKGKLLESTTLEMQAANNSKEQFANSPDLHPELQNAVIASFDAHAAMSKQALNSPAVMHGILNILLNHAGLWETLRQQAETRRI
jgi:type I site-specific restriction-modification system R (restriction) subunit